MKLRPLLPTLLLLTVTCAEQAAAQGGPERRRRHYNSSARPYYRGPVRLTAGLGAGLYNGDITGHLSDQFVGPSASVGLLYRIRPHWLVGGEATYFELGAKDHLPERNLAFRSRNGSGVAFLRWEPFHDEGAYADPRQPVALIKPYLKAGAGFLLYNPEAYTGKTRPTNSTSFLGPERLDYPALTVVAPVGVGVTLRLTSKLNASIEGSYYFTATDQLDDVSPASGRAISDKNRNDGYGLAELKLEYMPWRR